MPKAELEYINEEDRVMKQYTSPEQTAKLIELGFPKPENTQWNEQTIVRGIGGPLIELGIAEYRGSYSIGELIEAIPDTGSDNWRDRQIFGTTVYYYSEKGIYVCDENGELIDNLFDMVVLLKEGGVI